MSENETQVEFSTEERLQSVENQAYITYLLCNSIVKILTDKGILNQEQLAKEMDTLNSKLYEATKEQVEKETKEGA
ncbi:MAG: hypothetical protein RBR68_07235 [Tenuifilaceae bacterium]|jgi:hypothetical protein|nr:hypothetical protein [Tenuifilaceae bacterium]